VQHGAVVVVGHVTPVPTVDVALHVSTINVVNDAVVRNCHTSEGTDHTKILPYNWKSSSFDNVPRAR
jgi:hypothetical protein